MADEHDSSRNKIIMLTSSCELKTRSSFQVAKRERERECVKVK